MSNEFFPLHPAQYDVYMDQLINVDSPQYNTGGYLKLIGRLDLEKFKQAVASIPEVFDAFKMKFDLDDQTPTVYFDEHYRFDELQELAFNVDGDRKAYIEQWIKEQLDIPFTIKKDRLLVEQYLIKISDEEYWYYNKYHHLITDGYGIAAQMQYLSRKYLSLVAGEPVAFKYVTYREEAEKASAYFNSEDYIKEGQYWKHKIGEKPQRLLRRNYKLEDASGKKCGAFIIDIADHDRALLDELQLETKASLQQLTIAALMIYYANTSGQSEFVFGIPLHKRRTKQARSIVGMFTGVVPFKGEYEPGATLIDLLRKILAAQREDYRYQNYLIGDLNRHFKLNAADDYLVEIVVNNASLNFELDFGPGLQASSVSVPVEYLPYPLELMWNDYGKQQTLQLRIGYQLHYFSEADIQLFSQRILFILRQFQQAMQAPVEQIKIIPEQEYALLESFNNTAKAYPDNVTITDLFAAQAGRTPDAIALVLEEHTLTYSQLEQRANQLAHYLKQQGVGTGSLVPICTERSFEMIIGILGIMKAGGAYVPIDPAYPAARISYILTDCGENGVLVTTTALVERLAAVHNGSVLVCIDEERDLPVTAVDHYAGPQDLAYVIYTSGSTGTPKGVMITHTAVVNMIWNRSKDFGITEADRILQFSSFCFDAAVEQMYLALLNGAVLVLIPDSIRLDKELFARMLEQQRVTHIDATPGFLATVTPGAYGQLKRIVSGGEACNLQLAAAWSKYVAFYNEYGPTETTVIATGHLFTAASAVNRYLVPIGKPLANTRAYMLNKAGSIVPVGIPGELHIGGVQVARGYLHMPELTAEKFISDPFCKNKNKNYRLYKTGDLCRWLPDGTIEYLGRIDEQVKIRGYRVELGEIEHALQQCELVEQAVVLAISDAADHHHLVAYVVPCNDFDREGIISYLKGRLPDYMVPLVLMPLEQLPLTSNGKIDKNALPAPERDALLTQAYVAPRNNKEQMLAAIWQELLKVSSIGIHDNFFELGGDSIVAIQVVSRVRAAGYSLQPRDVFMHQTIGQLSAILTVQQTGISSNEQGSLTGASGLLPIQQWYFETAAAAATQAYFNQDVLLSIDKEVEADVLSTAIKQLLAHHDALRFTYSQDGTEWMQQYGTYEGGLDIVDLSSTAASDLAAQIEIQHNKYQRSLDIGKGIVFRAVLLLTPATEPRNRLLLIAHHLVVDGVSWRILLEDLALLLKDDQAALGRKSSSYRQWYQALTGYSNRRRLLNQKDHWKRVVEGYEPIRVDKKDEGLVTMVDMRHYEARLTAGQTRQLLQEASLAYHTDINDILLCALALTLTAWNNTSKIVIGLEGHGREDLAPDIDTSDTVGWFTSLYPVLLELPKGAPIGASLKDIKEQLRKTPDKGIGYGVLKYLNKAAQLQGAAPWDIVFNYLGQADNILQAGDLLSIVSSGAAAGDGFPCHEKISVDSLIQQGELVLKWTYSSKHFDAASIASLSAACLSHLELLITHCIEQAHTLPVYTPSDFGLGQHITNEELDLFLDANDRRSQVERIFRLSRLQEGMLFHSLYDEHTGAYIEQLKCELGTLDETVFRESWAQLVKRHTALRTGFYYDAFSIPVQCVYRQAELPIIIHDYRHLDDAAKEAAIEAYITKDNQQGFDFSTSPLMRISLLRLADDHYCMLWTSHHIMMDGWSLPVLVEELLNTYDSLMEGKNLAPAAANQDRYEDYIRYLDTRDQDRAEQYWRTYLAGVSEGCLLPFVNATIARTKGVGAYKEKKLLLDTAITARLTSYAQRHLITPNTLMQGVWAYLLYRYTGHQDIVYGVTVSDRPDELPGIEQRVGLYINTLPLYTRMQADLNIVSWLQQLQAGQLENRENQYVGLSDIQRWAGTGSDLFDSSITFQNYPVNELLLSKNWQLQIRDVQAHPRTNYPLTIVMRIAEYTSLLFAYNSDLLPAWYIERIAGHFEQALLQVLENEQGSIGDLDLLTLPEREQLQTGFNRATLAYKQEETFIDQFVRQAMRTPEAIALAFEGHTMTYRQLDERSNQLAHYLRLKGVEADGLVPVCLERSLSMIVAILGILKAGAAYVPIEPDFPPERIQYMLDDTAASVVVTSQAARQFLGSALRPRSLHLIDLDGDAALISSCPSTTPDNLPRPHQLLYVIYTSGSTGNPKGVLVTHRNLVDYLAGLNTHLPIAECCSFGLLSSIATDLGNTVLFPSLAGGGTLHLFSKSSINDAAYMQTYFEQHSIDCIKIVPSHWKALSDGELLLPQKLLVFGGEVLPSRIITDIRASGSECTIVNHYGPTETTIGKLLHVVDADREYDAVIPIGKPFSNTNVYVLNAQGQLCPAGVPGELYIGGDGVASGYLHNKELTASRFVDNIFAPGSRLYRTGDLVKYLPDGHIVFLGRVDDQVKIRGYRVESGEIARVLTDHETVSQAIVLASEDSQGQKRLIAYLIPGPDFDKEAVLAYLHSKLPDYMVPAALVTLEQFPLMANGKIDRRALPDPDVTSSAAQYEAPQTATERTLAAIWSNLLEVETIGLHDDFFALGGHSLLAIRVISAIRKQLQAEVAIGDIFDYPTIASLAQQLSKKIAAPAVPALVPGERPYRIPLSYSQERLWFIDQMEGSTHYHVPAVFRIKGQFDQNALFRALQTIVNRHEVLRTVIEQEEGQPYQRVLAQDQWQWQITDEAVYKESEAALTNYILHLLESPFDLSKDHKLRVHLIVLNSNEYLMVATLHHIASDGWSSAILVKELIALYAAYSSGNAVALPALGIQYADYAIWQRQYMSGAVLEQQLQYWQHQLSGAETLQLPTDRPRPALQSTRGITRSFHIDKALLSQLKVLCQHQGATLFMTLLAAFKVLLHRYSGQNDICVGTPVAGRTRQELEGLIGFFVNTLVVRSNLGEAPAFTALLQQIKQTMLEAYEHQDVPFEKIVDRVVQERDVSRTPLFQVVFVLQNAQEIPALRLADAPLIQEPVEQRTAKTDLNFTMQETPEGLEGLVEYCEDLFLPGTINRMIGHFEQLLRGIVADPAQSIASLKLLTPAEEQQLLITFNDTAANYPTDKTIIDVFEERVRQAPQATALICNDQLLTYQELNERANQLSRYLQKQGVTTESRVPLCIERSFEMIIAILGILKAGGVYVPVDPDYPIDRISYMLTDTAAQIAVSSSSCAGKLAAAVPNLPVISMDQSASRINRYAKTAPGVSLQAGQLAYIIYTSGSTGKPKGVMLEHKGVVNLALSQAAALRLQPGTRSLQFASFGFDASCYEIFNTLLSGGVLVLPHKEDLLSAEKFAALTTKHAVELVTLPPSYQHIIKEYLGPIKTIVSAGEPLNPDDARYMQSRGVRVVNAYGPTENTVCTSLTDDPIRKDHVITIGTPIANVQVYILGVNGDLCPIGIPGEICIGGAGLARGYWNRAELTAEKFIANPFSHQWDGRLYRTGDLGRWLADGHIEFLGRLDDQVKIRGYRIELGEIENVLKASALVGQAVVLAKMVNGNKQLVAYMEGAFDKKAIQAHLQQRLPEYMVPSIYITLDQLPLTPSGKIDRKALPEPGAHQVTHVNPRTQTEQALAAIWLQLLEVEQVGIYDDFFELGGDSLLAVRAVSLMKKNLQIDISISKLFELKNIASLGAYVETLRTNKANENKETFEIFEL